MKLLTPEEERQARLNSSLLCHYCQYFENKKQIAFITCHDRRGCHHVCFNHADWRLKKNWIQGHSPDCPHFTEKAK